MDDLRTGPDGLARCAWVGDDAEYRRYHDEERGPSTVIEPSSRRCRSKGSRRTQLDHDPAQASALPRGVRRVRARCGGALRRGRCRASDGGCRIIRNRAKILATMGNARLVEAMAPGELDALMWSFAPSPRPTGERPARFADVPATTAASDALSKALKKRGFRFVGSTTMYALMQSAGMVDDHLVGCHRAA
jgi:DNA-3-methyladenine glycosylase I